MALSAAINRPIDSEADENDASLDEQTYGEEMVQGTEEVDGDTLAYSFAHPAMSTRDTAPWDLYAKTMFSRFGYPLWHADPEVDEKYGPREVELGSVGVLKDGRFRHFFNARKAQDDPFNAGRVPPTFEQFNPTNLSIKAPKSILRQTYVASGSIGEIAVLLEGGTASPVASLLSGGGSVSFECKQNQGALLVLEEPGMSQAIPTKRHIVTYLRTHMETWFEWANSSALGFDIKIQEIKFVSGTLKTSKWACAAFSGSYRKKKGSLTLNVAGVWDVNMNITIKNQTVPSKFYNHGPSLPTGNAPRTTLFRDHSLAAGEDGRTASSESSTRSPLAPPCDQCIFFHYFTLKKRLFCQPKYEAAVGPHELPSDDDSDIEEDSRVRVASESAAEYDVSEEPSSGEVGGGNFDPVAVLLDYMLAKTEAEYAIASDRDVLAIFGAAGVPDDIMAGLEAANPAVEVDENDVATVVVDMTWLDQQISGEDTVQGNEVVGDPSGVEQAAETPEPEAEQGNTDPVIGDPAQGEGEEDEEGGDDGDTKATRRVQQAVQGPVVNAHAGSVTSLAVSPDSQWVASGSDDTMIILWEAETQSVVRKWESHDDIVWHLAFSPDSLRLASSGGEGRIMVWDVDTGEQLAILEGHAETIHTVVWSPDGTKLASGSDDTTVRIWDATTYEQLHLLEGHNAMVTFVLFSHNGQYLASGGADYNTRIWDVATGTQHKELRGHRGMVWTASFDAEDNRIATASDDGTVRIWKVETGEELVMLHEHHGPVWVVSFSPGDGKHILSGSSDSTLKICDSFTGERVVALEGHDSMINSATFSPDGRYVASASSDNTVRLWRRSDGTNMKTFNEHNDKVTHTLFSPDGEMLSSGSDDGTVRIRVLEDFVKLD